MVNVKNYSNKGYQNQSENKNVKNSSNKECRNYTENIKQVVNIKTENVVIQTSNSLKSIWDDLVGKSQAVFSILKWRKFKINLGSQKRI